MSACECTERSRPLPGLPRTKPQYKAQVRGDRPRQWFVCMRNGSHSYRNGGWSKKSLVHCRVCGAMWRTAASYVRLLKDCRYFPSRHPPKVDAL